MSIWWTIVAQCQPAEPPRMCRWFGHRLKLDEIKTYGGRIHLYAVNFYFFCDRCGAREIRKRDGAGHQPIDKKWLEETPQ